MILALEGSALQQENQLELHKYMSFTEWTKKNNLEIQIC